MWGWQVSNIDVQTLQSCVWDWCVTCVGERFCEVDVSEDGTGEKLCQWFCETGV